MVVDYLQAEIIKNTAVDSSGIFVDVLVHEIVDSTNNWSLQQCTTGKTLPFACFAEQQTSGRGRRGKRWLMSAHNNIAMSICWPFDLSAQPLHLLPLSIALAIVETLEDMGLKQVQIKWPNDVYVQGKKIAGILIETQAIKGSQVTERLNSSDTGGQLIAAVIGLGLNYHMLMSDQMKAQDESLVLTDICEQIKLQAIKIKPERNYVASALLHKLIAGCQSFAQTSGENLEKYRASYDYCYQKKVDIILDNKEVLSGLALGVNDNAELVVLVDGKQRVFNSAEVSVRTGKGADV